MARGYNRLTGLQSVINTRTGVSSRATRVRESNKIRRSHNQPDWANTVRNYMRRKSTGGSGG